MFPRFRSALLALATAIGLAAGVVVLAPTAQAVTWTNLGLITDTTYVDNCDGTTGAIRVELEWQLSSNYKLRLNKNRDIKFVNNSKTTLQIQGGSSQIQGSVTMIRLQGSGPGRITTYNNWFTIGPNSTKSLSVDNPDRWVRMDDVVDSDPSPYGNAIATGSDPAMEIFGPLHTSAGPCGSFYTEIVNNAA